MLFLRPALFSLLLISPSLAAPTSSPVPIAGATVSLKRQPPAQQKGKSGVASNSGWMPFRLIVPSIKMDIPILRGSDLKTLTKGPGHDLLSVAPGHWGNSVIASHRNIEGAHFWYLNKVTAGSQILIETPYEMQRYRVTFAGVVPETRTEILESSIPLDAAPRLTLYTCTLPISTKRFVVVANLVSRTPVPSKNINRVAVVPEIISGPLHLLKDKALRARAEARLRAQKNRPAKPLPISL